MGDQESEGLSRYHSGGPGIKSLSDRTMLICPTYHSHYGGGGSQDCGQRLVEYHHLLLFPVGQLSIPPVGSQRCLASQEVNSNMPEVGHSFWIETRKRRP